MQWRLGTMGFGYAEWAGVFYPPGTKPADYLAYYATRFDAVELDTTFHAMPDASRVRRWTSAVPETFRCCVKTPRTVTHDTPIEKAGDEMKRFIDVVREFGAKLGVVLIQFPPSFKAASSSTLDLFLRTLPDDVRFAIEFRHDSWQTDRTAALLRQYRVCLVAGDYHAAPHPIRPTADFLYVRWIGVHRQFPALNREEIDVTDRLEWWKERLDRHSEEVRTVWGLFNNDFSGYAIATCDRFRAMLGIEPPPRPPGASGSLFD